MGFGEWINRLDGTHRSYDDKGNRTTVDANGVTVEPDPHFRQSDMDAYQAGQITDVEYRRRYNARYHGRA